MIAVIAVATIASGVIGWRFIFPLPLLFSSALVVALAAAYVAAQPILTGRFEGKAQPRSGRATIYKKPGGEEYLRLSDFTTSNGPDVHIMLARSVDLNVAQKVVNGALEPMTYKSADIRLNRVWSFTSAVGSQKKIWSWFAWRSTDVGSSPSTSQRLSWSAVTL